MKRGISGIGVLGVVASLLCLVQAAEAGEVRVAVAANFTAAMRMIAAEFKKGSGDEVTVSYGSTGTLYAQIRNGAPFDVFLAADVRRPRLLESDGLAVPGTRFTYAIGQLVLWSAEPDYVDPKGAVLSAGRFSHLAIANPKTAPYGAAAREALSALGLWSRLGPRIVSGESIAQTYQFVASGAAELGFVALAQVRAAGASARGSGWEVPQRLYHPIEQQAVLLRRGRDNTAAVAFVRYLKGPQAQAVIRRLGYAVP